MYRGVVAGAAVVALAAGSVFVFRGTGPADEAPSGREQAQALDHAAKDRLAEAAAIAAIAADSRAVDADAGRPAAAEASPTQAPPGFVPAPLPAHEPVPPPGFEFVSRHEVRHAPMTVADIDGAQTPAPAWMASGEADLVAQAAASGRDWTFGWVKLAAHAGVGELGAILAEEGGAVLGQSGDLVRARLPGDAARLRTIAAAAPVAGLGTWPASRKVTATLRERALADAREREKVPVWITLMDGDPDGRWRSALQDIGAQVGRFDPALRVYAATLPRGALARVADADYVLAVEAIGRLKPAIEFATATAGADAVRRFDESTSIFTGVGGASVPIGVLDSGLNLNHPDISSNRRSICGANFVSEPHLVSADQDIWWDQLGHGTMVTGVLLGSGSTRANRAGVAPLVQDIRFAKTVGGLVGVASALSWSRALDWLAQPTECGEGVPRKALVINASLGFATGVWESRSVVERKIDASVWAARQVFVSSAGNSGASAFSNMAAAKNALAVGSTMHHGDIVDHSSRGPTYDGRLFPNVVALGVRLAVPDGGQGGGYTFNSGTSFASPNAAGVAALVMEAVPSLREEPAAVRAHLMASAIKPDVLLDDPNGFASHNTHGPGRLQSAYGLGKVSARTAVLNRDADHGWTTGVVAFDADADRYAYADIEVPPGASRLDIVLTWDEPAAEVINNAVFHDLDLWVDPGLTCGDQATCGEYQSRSRIDNVEWVIIRNPSPGTYRLKALPTRIFGVAPRAGLAWTVIRGDSTPSLAVTVDAADIEVAPDEPFDVPVTVSSNGYVASGTMLRLDCLATEGSHACHDLDLIAREHTRTTREDGTTHSLERDHRLGATYSLGEIGPDERQTVTVRMKGRPEGSFRLHFTATAWNARAGSGSVGVVVGEPETVVPAPRGTPPNDAFAAATELVGAEGETLVEPFLATGEVGEPALGFLPGSDALRTVVRTVWYRWTAEEPGLIRFSLPQALPDDYSGNVLIGVYEGSASTALRPVGPPKYGGGNTFLALAGSTYWIRLGVTTPSLVIAVPGADGSDPVNRQRSTPTLTLSWAPGVRPANDDYALAESIEEESGAIRGNNQAATTEAAELMGFASRSGLQPADLGKTASVWYRWTAPSSGDWKFSSESHLVAVYTGADVTEARLVSGVPAADAVFPAAWGEEYRISVASRHAYVAGGDFELSWGAGARKDPGNDDFAGALAIENFAMARVNMDTLTVQSGEPLDSGARTLWFDWRAPADGRYLWRVYAGSLDSSSLRQAPLQIAVFEGDALASLRTEAVDDATDATMLPDIVFDARADALYRLAVGLPRGAAEVPLGTHRLVLELGEVPENDDLANAAPLSGATGSVTASNKFATLETGEISAALGDSSMWWTYQVEESAWIRFAVGRRAGTKIAVYRRDMYGGLELLDTTYTVGGSGRHHTAVNILAEPGVEYVLRVGAYVRDEVGRGGNSLGEFSLSWGPGAPRARLRYVDGLYSGFGLVGEQAFNESGTEHYLADHRGLRVSGRDAETGRLTHLQTLADYPVRNAQLRWDTEGAALLVATCGDWWRFVPREGGGLEYAGVLAGAPCPSGRVLLHGSHLLNLVRGSSVETYAFDEDRVMLTLVARQHLPGVEDAVLTADGANLYALAKSGSTSFLHAMTRDVETGALTIDASLADGDETGDGAEVEGLRDVEGMAVDGSHLFLAVGSGGTDTMAFDLADRTSPVFLGVLRAFFGSTRDSDCRHLSVRSNVDVLDVFCARNAHYYTVQVAPGGALLAEDYSRLLGWSDSFGNRLPRWFSGAIGSIVSSPDGRHIYMVGNRFSSIRTSGNELHTFERVYGAED